MGRRKFTVIHAGSEIEAAKISVGKAQSGEVSALMKGNIHTEILMHEALKRKQGIRLKRRPSHAFYMTCLLYTSPSPRDGLLSRMPSSA